MVLLGILLLVAGILILWRGSFRHADVIGLVLALAGVGLIVADVIDANGVETAMAVAGAPLFMRQWGFTQETLVEAFDYVLLRDDDESRYVLFVPDDRTALVAREALEAEEGPLVGFGKRTTISIDPRCAGWMLRPDRREA